MSKPRYFCGGCGRDVTRLVGDRIYGGCPSCHSFDLIPDKETMNPLLPTDRRTALDAALVRVVADLAPDTPLAIQLDYFKEHVSPEPVLAEWCLWLAEALDWECRLLDLWTAWVGQAEGESPRFQLMNDLALDIELFQRTVLEHSGLNRALGDLAFRGVAYGRAILGTDHPAVQQAEAAARETCLRDLKRRVLVLFPEVVWKRALHVSEKKALLYMERKSGMTVEQTAHEIAGRMGWGKRLDWKPRSHWDGERRVWYFRETITADRLIPLKPGDLPPRHTNCRSSAEPTAEQVTIDKNLYDLGVTMSAEEFYQRYGLLPP